jgi:hypothetical protein
MAAAAMPWLRYLESQRWGFPVSATTVPPPEQATMQVTSSGGTQSVARPRDTSVSPPAVPPPARGYPAAPIPPAPHDQGKDLRQGNGVSGGNDPPPASGYPVSQSDAKSPATDKIADTSQSSPPKPQILLDRAVRAVETRSFISAQIKQHGELIGQQITGVGQYYELPKEPIPRIHLELTMQVGSVSTSLVLVCNGTTLWTYRKLPNGEKLSKLDAVRAMTALKQVADKRPREAIATLPGLGGLGRLMRGLNSQFEFTSVVAEQLDGLPVWKLSGGWKPAQLARLLPNQKDAIDKGRTPDLTRLPGHLPDSVTLYLGKEDCFPFRIDYLRSVPRASPRCLIGLEFFNLNFNGPIDAGQFLYTPAGNLEIIDHTDEFVHSLGEGG